MGTLNAVSGGPADLMQGNRREDGAVMLLEGDYCIRNGVWHGVAPGNHAVNLKKHEVTEHSDGTITVYPSIVVFYHAGNLQRTVLWHGRLEKGVWSKYVPR